MCMCIVYGDAHMAVQKTTDPLNHITPSPKLHAGFLFLAALILVATCAEMTIVMTYFQARLTM